MIKIGDVLLSDSVIEECFVCDLKICKGGCCVDGDAGAPLENEELQKLNEAYPVVKPLLSKEAVEIIEKNGKYVYDAEFGWVTPILDSGMCVYGRVDENGIVKCSLEQVYNEGSTNWKKPVSCHLFPIKVKKSKKSKNDLVNYEPREELCKAACSLGKKQKIPVYVFLKEAIIRKYGKDFYKDLVASAAYLKEKNF
jgi:Protein of unknown function (DUF3109)